MTTPLVVGQVVKCRIWCDTVAGGGQASVNTLGYIVSAVGGSPATDTDVAATLDALIATPLKALLTSLATYKGVQAQICNPTFPYKAIYIPGVSIAGAGVGGVAGNPMPTQICGLLSFASGKAGPQNRGRMYVPFPGVADDNGGGSAIASYVTRLDALGLQVAVGLAPSAGGRTATLARVLLHGTPKEGPISPPDAVTGGSSHSSWATQRRRGAYGRQNRSPI